MSAPIMVPVDRSDFAEEVLPLAAEIGRRTETPLELVLVHHAVPILPDTGWAGSYYELDVQIRAEERAYLERLERRLEAETGVTVTSVLLDGPIASTLIDHAKGRAARLVAMTTHGRGGISRVFLGSVADQLIRGLHCPVLLVHPGYPARPLRPTDKRRVLIPLDGSALAESVIDQVLDLLGAHDIALEMVQVVAPLHELMFPSDAPLSAPSQTEVMVLAASRYLRSIAVRLGQAGLTVHAETRIGPSVPGAIIGYAESHHADLIAIATHGLGGMERALLGSVADKLVRSVRVPLLVWNAPAGATSDLLEQTVSQPSEPSLTSAGA